MSSYLLPQMVVVLAGWLHLVVDNTWKGVQSLLLYSLAMAFTSFSCRAEP
jgi:hypothetical protein